MIMVNDLRENYGIFLSIVIYPVIPKVLFYWEWFLLHHFIRCRWNTYSFEAIREKLENGTYKEIASRTTVDLDA
jgi:glycine C-acetyltransferase